MIMTKKPKKQPVTPSSRALTPKQSFFCEVLATTAFGSASAAYRLAYDAGKMTPEAVHVEASRLMADPKIALRLGVLRAELSERHRHTLDTVLAETQDILNRALARNSLKVACDVIALKIRMLGLDKAAALGAAAGQARDPLPDVATFSNAELDAVEIAINAAVAAAARRQDAAATPK